MKEARISEINNHLSRYLALVRRGETIRILEWWGRSRTDDAPVAP